MDRMSPLDASFLAIEDENTPMHIGNVSIFEGPPPTYGDVVRMVASKLPLVPRYRQKVRMVPLQLGRPVWVDDPHFQILYHIRHTAVPSPAATSSSATWPGGSSPSRWTAASRCGRSGSSRGSRAGAGR